MADIYVTDFNHALEIFTPTGVMFDYKSCGHFCIHIASHGCCECRRVLRAEMCGICTGAEDFRE